MRANRRWPALTRARRIELLGRRSVGTERHTRRRPARATRAVGWISARRQVGRPCTGVSLSRRRWRATETLHARVARSVVQEAEMRGLRHRLGAGLAAGAVRGAAGPRGACGAIGRHAARRE